MSSGSGSSEGRRKTVSWADEKGVVEKEEAGEEEFGKRAPVKKASPREPSRQEREEHDKTHIPFRN